jgi:hypothetical protein
MAVTLLQLALIECRGNLPKDQFRQDCTFATNAIIRDASTQAIFFWGLLPIINATKLKKAGHHPAKPTTKPF